MKVRYSMEAAALALVLFTTGIEEALVAACVVAVGTIIGDSMAERTDKRAAAVVGGAATFLLLIWTLTGLNLIEAQILSAGFLDALLVGILVGVHVWKGTEPAGDGEILKENGLFLVVMLVVGAVREFFGSGALYGYTLVSGTLISSAYAKVYFGLIFGGLGIAALNTMLKKEASADCLWVAVAVALSTVLGGLLNGDGAGAVLTSLIAAVIAVVLLVSVRGKLIYSGPGKHFAGLPVEMLSFGFLTMMLTVIA